MSFKQKISEIQQAKKSVLCVGLDPDPTRLPASFLPAKSLPDRVLAFNKAIIEATAPYACAFKLNFAFYEAMGLEGWRVLQETVAMLPADVVSIADAKRGDIGNSAKFYAKSVYETLGFDSCTVAPYMGRDSFEPFLLYPDKLTFILARTSNPGAADLQEQILEGAPLYEMLTRKIAELPADQRSRAGLVVGATSPEALARIRNIVPGMPFLIPGVGAQGGDEKAVMQASYDGAGSVLINSSRGIIYAGTGADFAEAAAEAASTLQSRLFTAMN